MRRSVLTAASAVAVLLGSAVVATTAGAGGATAEYAVLYARGASASAAHAAVQRAGGTVVSENAAVGLATVTSNRADFATRVGNEAALYGAARNRPIGYAPDDATTARDAVEQEGRSENATGPRDRSGGQTGTEPLASQQWDMDMIGAPAAHQTQAGDHRVVVGVIDTGIDGSHPDIAPNFDRERSRNFTTDVPVIDGACADDPDGSCSDPNDVDEDGHGTHVAGTIASPINGVGIAGVAPNVTLVNIRAGQDSGYFFLKPTVDALTYAADIGVDVVNMSFYIDPWLYNCAANPADSADAQAEQRTIVEATQRALEYAHDGGVTLVGASGNEHTDLGHPTSDATSPDFPPGTNYPRTVDNTCLDLPTEGAHVLSVNSVGPSGVKADYSNYGLEQATVAAPGGFFRDWLGTPQNRVVQNEILAPYPESVGRAAGTIDANGNPTTTGVVKDCTAGPCSYYQWIQGTSMAAPHVTGVVALIVSQFGHKDGKVKGGLTMKPDQVEEILLGSAVPHACPSPADYSYVPYGRSWTNTCEGTTEFNGFYGHGIVNAADAVAYDRG